MDELDFKEIEEKEIFDYVSNNYWKLSKDVLKDIIKELSYAIHTNVSEDKDKSEIILKATKIQQRFSAQEIAELIKTEGMYLK